MENSLSGSGKIQTELNNRNTEIIYKTINFDYFNSLTISEKLFFNAIKVATIETLPLDDENPLDDEMITFAENYALKVVSNLPEEFKNTEKLIALIDERIGSAAALPQNNTNITT